MEKQIYRKIHPVDLENALRSGIVRFFHHKRGKDLKTYLGTSRISKIGDPGIRKKSYAKGKIVFYNFEEGNWDSIPISQNIFIIETYPAGI